MELFFKILAVILIGVAAFFLWRGDQDAMFVAAVLGAVSFFVSLRFQVKERIRQRKQIEEETARADENAADESEKRF